ncbi:MAG: hypothetical protein Q9174_006011, partial [Haloplaca sp. 1 TL-2023]
TNGFTSFTSQTNSLGVATGMPEVATSIPEVVTSQPDPVLVNTATVETAIPSGPQGIPAPVNGTTLVPVVNSGAASPTGGMMGGAAGNGTSGGNSSVPVGTMSSGGSGSGSSPTGGSSSSPSGTAGAGTEDSETAEGSNGAGLVKPIVSLGLAGAFFALFL